MKQGLVNWRTAMKEAGLAPANDNGFEDFVRGETGSSEGPRRDG